MEEEKIFANALNQSTQIGPIGLRKIKNFFGSFQKAWGAPLETLRKASKIKELREFRKGFKPEKEFESLKKKNIKVLLKEELPRPLQEIPIPPEILYLKGNLPEAKNVFLAIVGTRKHTAYGEENCRRIIDSFKNYDIVIVSGLAIGIDSIAHKSALKNQLKTIAVLGSGLSEKVIYPRTNLRLAQEIVQKDGCLISEYPFKMKAARFAFPQRNRIIAGLSRGTLVIEAPEKSGALITAFFSLEFNREVFSIPGSVFSSTSAGNNYLIKLGALAVTEAKDILQNLGIKPKENKQIFKISPIEESIINLLSEPIERDELIRKSGMPPYQINPVLTQMEMKNLIKEINGKICKLI